MNIYKAIATKSIYGQIETKEFEIEGTNLNDAVRWFNLTHLFWRISTLKTK